MIFIKVNKRFLFSLNTFLFIVTCSFLFFNPFADLSEAQEKKRTNYEILEDQTVLISSKNTIKPESCEFKNKSEKCTKEIESLPPLNFESTGTGTFVRFKNRLVILTVAHICENKKIPDSIDLKDVKINLQKTTTFEFYNKNITGSANVEKIDSQTDLCLLSFDSKDLGEILEPAKIAEEIPERGSKVQYAGAPYGLMDKDFMLSYEGTFSGTYEGAHILAIPCAVGTSGSSVRNQNREVFSVIKQVHTQFSNICYGVGYSDIKKFLEVQ